MAVNTASIEIKILQNKGFMNASLDLYLGLGTDCGHYILANLQSVIFISVSGSGIETSLPVFWKFCLIDTFFLFYFPGTKLSNCLLKRFSIK